MTRSGLILDDRYRLDERIAAGGVGQVWRATDLLLYRPVAVKVLRPEYSDHPETLDRFRKEARHAGALSNPHVAQVYDYGPSGPDGSPFLVMEYVDGPSLADILMVDPIDPVRALDVISQAADGLSSAHRAGLVHRDVKPGNILISKAGVVKVTDFGIAHAAGQAPVTGPGLVMGTTQYMAPERIAGGPGTAASDIYALGIVLHECLTGVPPHDGGPAEVMAAHLYLPLPSLPASVPPEIEELVAQLTVKDPALRITDALEVADLAARLRDSLSGGTFVPSARTGAYTGPAAAVPSPVPQVAALASEPASALADGSGPAGLAGHAGLVGSVGGSDPFSVNGSGTDSAARGIAGSTSADHTVAMPPPDRSSSPDYISDEWNVPSRMSLPTRPAQADQPERPRRRPGAVAIGAAAVASAGLIALLVSGVFSNPPVANQQPAGSSTRGTGTGRTPSPSASRAAHSSGSAGGTASPGGSATPGTSSSQSTHPGNTASASPSTTSPAGPSSSGSPSTSPSGGSSSSPSASPSAPPSGTPSSPAGGSPAPSPTPSSSCLLGICL